VSVRGEYETTYRPTDDGKMIYTSSAGENTSPAVRAADKVRRRFYLDVHIFGRLVWSPRLFPLA
jgi:hypothetical protein